MTREVLLAMGRFGTDTGGYKAMVRYCRQWRGNRPVFVKHHVLKGAHQGLLPVGQRDRYVLTHGQEVVLAPLRILTKAHIRTIGAAVRLSAAESARNHSAGSLAAQLGVGDLYALALTSARERTLRGRWVHDR